MQCKGKNSVGEKSALFFIIQVGNKEIWVVRICFKSGDFILIIRTDIASFIWSLVLLGFLKCNVKTVSIFHFIFFGTPSSLMLSVKKWGWGCWQTESVNCDKSYLLMQSSNYLFRSDLQRFREKFQQLEATGECSKPSHWGFEGQIAIQMQENGAQFNTLWSKI